MWFEELTGFKEKSAENVRAHLEIDGDAFVSTVNNERFVFGELEIPTLTQLREKSDDPDSFSQEIKVSEIVADVQQLHCEKANTGALFQAASQFNLLEMKSPGITPERGIDIYEQDHTQGPACAIACGAGTIYRNYYAKVGSQQGQTTNKQIDCLDLIGAALKNEKFKLWQMRNGYAMIPKDGLLQINKAIAQLSQEEREELKGKLKVGIQWNTEVTKSFSRHKVSQVYCSALPVSYNSTESMYWEYFSRVILEAAYEASLHAALINLKKNDSAKVYLTLLGGGAFGNEEYWILESLEKALRKFRKTPLDVMIVSYGRSNPHLKKHIQNL